MPNYSKTFWKLGNRDYLVWSALTIWTDFTYIHTQIHKEEEKKECNNPIWMRLICGPLLPSPQSLNLANGYTKKKRKKSTHISVWCFGTLCFLLLRLRSAMTVISRAKTTFSYTPATPIFTSPGRKSSSLFQPVLFFIVCKPIPSLGSFFGFTIQQQQHCLMLGEFCSSGLYFAGGISDQVSISRAEAS